MARKLIVEILGDSKSLERSFTRSSAAANKFGRDVDTGVGRAEARFSKLKGVAAGGFVGGIIASAGLEAIKSVVTAAAESQQILGQTRVALEATGKSWADYGAQIEDTVRQQSKLGFEDEDLLRTFSLFQRHTGDVTESLRENNLAMDIARARFIDLQSAANIVNKAALGMAGSLRRIGIDTKGATTGTELLTLLTEKYGGSAQAAAKDSSTALERVAVSTRNLKESIGTLLLPAVTLLADDLAAVADVSALVVTGLRNIGDTKIPTINIPFTITIGGHEVGGDAGGGTVGGLLGRAAHFAKFTPLNPLFGITIAKAIADQFRDQAEAATPSLATEFAATINTLTSNALTQAGQITSGGPPPGLTGPVVPKVFGAGLKPSDLFGPKITGITKALDEALLDAELSGKGVRSVRVKQRQLLINALDDPRNNRDDRIKIKTALKGVKDSIASIDADVAAGLAAADAERTARLEKASAAAKEAARKHAEKLKKIAEHKADLLKKAAEAARKAAAAQKAAAQTRQFRAIGLDPEGGDIIPTVANIRKQFAQLTARLSDTGKPLGSKLAKSFEGVGKLLAGKLGPITVQTREAIKNLFATIRQTFDEESSKTSGPLTRTSSLNSNRILEGLGLDRHTEKELRARLSSFNSAGKSLAGATRPTGQFASIAGGGDVVVNLTTTLDGQVVAQNTTRHQIAGKRRNPWQKRGPNRGTWGF